ncbi:MAG: sigma-70 family RNA polymerase sigma factor, partial [Bacteroidota bacterium]
MNHIDDDILIDLILNGDHKLFEKLVERHQSYAFTIALNVLKNKEDAEEAAHDSFLKAYKNLSKFNKEAKFSTWLYRIVFNTAVTYQRKKKVIKVDLTAVEHNYSQDEKSKVEASDQK